MTTQSFITAALVTIQELVSANNITRKASVTFTGVSDEPLEEGHADVVLSRLPHTQQLAYLSERLSQLAQSNLHLAKAYENSVGNPPEETKNIAEQNSKHNLSNLTVQKDKLVEGGGDGQSDMSNVEGHKPETSLM